MSACQDGKRRHLSADGEESTTQRTGIAERNLCIMYGDHDECPVKEVDEDGVYVSCNCTCHLFPESLTD